MTEKRPLICKVLDVARHSWPGVMDDDVPTRHGRQSIGAGDVRFDAFGRLVRGRNFQSLASMLFYEIERVENL